MEEQKRGSEIIFLGSGPSGLIPRVSCLTEPLKEDGRRRCKVCEDAYLNHNSKNRRGNTSLLIRYAHPDGNFRNILIDCGKSFRYFFTLSWRRGLTGSNPCEAEDCLWGWGRYIFIIIDHKFTETEHSIVW